MEEITIKYSSDHGWLVIQGNKTSDRMTWDEMMGLLASLTMPRDRPCLQWMRTEAQRKQLEDQIKSNEDNSVPVDDLPFA